MIAVVAVVAAALIVAKPFDKPSSSPAVAAPQTSGVAASRTAGVAATISMPGRIVRNSPGVSPQVPAVGAKYFQRDSQTVSITPSGPLEKQAVVKLRLNSPPQPGEVAAILTSESPNGPWQVLPGTVVDGGRYVEATVSHLSFFSAFLVDWHALLNDLEGAWNSFTDGAYSNASQPSCDNKSAATQDGYSTTVSMKGKTVLWCYGVENGRRVLKIIDNRRYPLLVAHGLPLTGGSSSGDVFQRAASLLNLGDALVYPQDEADFSGTVAAGRWSALAGNYAPVAGYLASLSVGVQAWLAIVTRGNSAKNPSKVMDTVDQMLTLDTCRAAAMGGDASDIQGSCFTPDMFGKVFGAFWGYMLSIVQTVSEFANWVRSTLNAFADSIDGRSSFEITVRHAATANALSSFLGYWGVHDGGLCVGSVLPIDGPGSKITATPPCSGSSSVGWTYAWGCGASTSSGVPVCAQYYTVNFTSNSDGSITGTITGNPIYVDANGNVVEQQPSFWQAFKKGDTFTLKHADTGLLTVTYLDGSPGYFCNYSTVSAANRPKCGA